MQFSSVATLVDAYVLGQINGKPIKGASIFVYVASKNPLILEDNAKIQLTASEDDLQTYFQSYDKISQGSSICLDGVDVHLDYGKGFRLLNVEFSSKRVVTEIGSNKEKDIKNFEIKVVLQKKDGLLPLALTTFNYIRRMERQELAKKHYKPSKIDLLAFVPKNSRAKDEDDKVSSEVASLDSESIALLHRLLPFTDKEELFRVLIKKPLKEKSSKKSVRLSIIPTDVDS